MDTLSYKTISANKETAMKNGNSKYNAFLAVVQQQDN